MTLIVKGTCASELRTRFWPIRLTYSFTTGSCTSFTLCSTCIEYCLPMRISLSSEYQSPMPRPPTLRLPIASTSFLLPSCFTLLSSGSCTGGGPLGAALPSALVADESAGGVVPGVAEESCAGADGCVLCGCAV